MQTLVSRGRSLMLLCLFTALSLIGCGGGGGDSVAVGAGGGGASVSVLLTDAPTDEMKEVWVSVREIRLLGGARQEVIFSSNPATEIDLLSLTGESAYLGTKDEVPAGCYDKIRLQIDAIELVPKDENEPPILLTGNALPANGKIDLNPRDRFCLEEGEQVAVQLDMDAEKSLHIVKAGNSGKYKVRPVVFVDILREPRSGKLVRLSGQVAQIAPAEEAFLLCPAQVRPLSSLQSAREVSECLEVSTRHATIFNANGDPVGLAGLNINDRVEVLGHLLLAENPQAFDVARVFDAVLVEIGMFQKLSGTIDQKLDDNAFRLRLDPSQGYAQGTILEVRLTAESRIYSTDGTALSGAALTPGTIVMVDGILDPTLGVLKTALVVVRADAGQNRIQGVVTAISTAGLTVRDNEGAEHPALFTPWSNVYRLQVVEGSFQMLPSSPAAIRVGDEVTLFVSHPGLVQDVFLLN
ncbi:DUF4382 domain-containing protein [Geoalkalibacter sp.]|uniref:DUF4382 domain-containing protein n=1 Tax=Geoalkalibacter sp. TaxID=3041440 RepID=UPI00272EE222|nr:DUF4382 domain-containing protein [Geoalkalibacter sp.]